MVMLGTNRYTIVAAGLLIAGLMYGCGREETTVTIEGIATAFPEDAKSFPLAWRLDGVAPDVDPLPKEQIKAATEILRTTFGRYPDGFLSEHLTNVSVFAHMVFDGAGSAGTYAQPSTIYVSYLMADPIWMEEIAHSLIAALLYHKYPDVIDQVDFDYQTNPPTGVSEDLLLERDVGYLKRGYLYPYSATSEEDDFATLAGALMAGSKSAQQDARDYKLLGEKMEKVKRFFAVLDKRFTEDFFRR